jgi:membrane protease YdiL (CAAX protease family)
VTALAAILVCNIQVRSLLQAGEFRLLRLHEPARSVFIHLERQRRVAQSGLLPRFLRTDSGDCASLANRQWDSLLTERVRFLNTGHRRKGLKGLAAAAESGRLVSLAGCGDAASAQRLRTEGYGNFPDYFLERSIEIANGDTEAEASRIRATGRLVVAEYVAKLLFILGAAACVIAWCSGVDWPRRAARSRLAAPTLALGLMLFIWAKGFQAVCTALRWADPDGMFGIFGLLPGLSLATGICVLFVGTRSRRNATPLKDLLRCPRDRRTQRAVWIVAVGATGLSFAFNFLMQYGAARVGADFSSDWPDSIRENRMFGTAGEAALSIFGAVVLAPFGEELAYRGALFGALATRLSTHRAALISCLIFAGFHGYGWLGFCSVAFYGYLQARLAARTGSLVPGMLSHGMVNLVYCIGTLGWRL